MSLLEDIQRDLTETSTSLESALFKCQRLAARLGSSEFREWVSRELEGYEGVESLPPYRTIGATSLGEIMGPLGSGASNMPIPVVPDMPEKILRFTREVELRHSVAELESLVAGKENEGLRFPWPMELVQAYSPKVVHPGSQLVAVDRIVSASAIRGTLSKIRRRLLEFILEIERDVPGARTTELVADQATGKQVAQIFQTTVYGGIVAIASPGAVQGSPSTVIAGDLASLVSFFESNGVSQHDIASLKRAVKRDPSAPEEGKLGKRVAKWVSKMTQRAASGIWKIGLSVAAKLIADALAGYYGWTG